MKVEKINENKVKITLTLEELEKRDISLTEIEKDASIAKDLFIDLIEESNLEEDFAIENSQLFIEATSESNNLFIITITKIDDIPELRKYSHMSNENKLNKSKNDKNSKKTIFKYKVDSNVYWFDNLDLVLDLCQIANKENLFFGRNSLYKYNDSYFIVFNESSVKNKKFLKTFVFLSEFCKEYFSSGLINAAVKEKSELIIQTSALQKLSKI
ncbi:MAG: adaptor protein MecA [Clostridia bacterium]